MLPLIIEPSELQENLNLKDLLIVDLSKRSAYDNAHIPGAVHVDPREIISGTPPSPGKLASLGQLETLFARIGYSSEQQIVAYDDEGGGWAGRFIWTLDTISHAKSSYLNGGIHAWIAAKGQLTAEIPEVTPSSVTLKISNQFTATMEEVLASLKRKDVRIWDARSKEEFLGEKKLSARGGHIPGAINLDWLDTMDHDDALRIRTNVKEILTNRGLSQDKKIITHCQSHHRSGLTYLIGKSLGYDIRAYPGSWSEWGNNSDTPVETG
jgi:thiosulfate/3-mercaptopyruvate sulfurtransferase